MDRALKHFTRLNFITVDGEAHLTEICQHIRYKVLVICYYLGRFIFTKYTKQFGMTISVVLALRSTGKSHSQIADYVKFPKSTMTRLIYPASRNLNEPYGKIKRAEQPPKLNGRSRRALIRYFDRFPHDNLAALGTPSESGHRLSRGTVRFYLKGR